MVSSLMPFLIAVENKLIKTDKHLKKRKVYFRSEYGDVIPPDRKGKVLKVKLLVTVCQQLRCRRMDDSAPITFSFHSVLDPSTRDPYLGVRGWSSLFSYTWLESPSPTSPKVCVGEYKLHQAVYED